MSARPAEIDRTLAALADPYCRRAVELLAEAPRPAGELARELSLAPPAMSRRLKTLRESGLVEETHPAFDARVRIYALRPEPMVHLQRWLAEAERMWSGQLAAFKAHVEKGR
ncbi:ArsR/SmtB family transcription factor [Phenylobacterium soli]|uniref:ArsR/SmtB family transcription factor n=1 Tax=Phenylobacterium soli TaxID=2170551 RepID=UPI001D03B7B5|nr:metalloregulator ArsR/SmtB family transcription factor [Phenylobacterium soli]